jgi:pyruvate,water dikinase
MDQNYDPMKKEQEIAARRHFVEARTLALIQRKWLDRVLPWKKWLLLQVIGSSRAYILCRENQRFYFEKLVFFKKKLLLEISQNLARHGWIDEADQAKFLTLEEVHDILEDKLPATVIRQLIHTRQAEFEINIKRRMPAFYLDDTPYFGDDRGIGKTLKGLGVSPGVYTGPVRVIRSFDDLDKIVTGEILVTKATDPGWTPIFLKLGGIIMELGSLLSHGAVVAREYNLPAVVNVKNVTSLLRNGQMVTIDGADGSVHLHP